MIYKVKFKLLWWQIILGSVTVLLSHFYKVQAAELTACKQNKNDLNTLLGIPRVNMAFQSVPKDLGKYESLVDVCDSTSGNLEICSADWLDEINSDGYSILFDRSYAKEHEDSWVNYSQGLIMYAIIGVVFALLTIVAAAAAILVCCCERSHKTADASLDQSFSETPRKYPTWQIVTTYLCLVTFLVLILTFTLLVLVRGNMGLTEAQIALVDAPDNLASLTSTASDPFINLSSAVIGVAGVSMITRVNQTLFDVGELSLVHSSIVCAENVFSELFDSNLTSTMLQILANLNATLSSIPSQSQVNDTVNSVLSDLDVLNASLGTSYTQVLSFQNGVNHILSLDLDSQIAWVDSEVSVVDTELSSIDEGISSYIKVRNDAQNVLQTIAPLLAEANYTQVMVSNFSSYYSSFNVSVRDLTPSASEMQIELTRLNSSLTSLQANLTVLKDDLSVVNTTIADMPTISELNISLNGIVEAIDDFNFTSLYEELAFITTFFSDLPSIEPITETIGAILELSDELPCMFEIADVPESINENLIELPDELLNVTAQLKELNNTYVEATKDLPDLLDQIETFADSFNGSLIEFVDELNAELSSAQTVLNETKVAVLSLQSKVASIDLSSVNVTSAISSINKLITQISDPNIRPNNETNSTLTAFGSAHSSLIAVMDSLEASDFLKDVQNVESVSPQSWTCHNNDTLCYVYGGPYIIQDSCTKNNDLCEYPFEDWESLQNVLSAFVLGVDSIDPSLSEMKSQIETAQSAIATIDLGCCNDFSSLETASSDLINASNSFSSGFATIEGVRSNVAAITSKFSSLEDDKSKFEDALSDIQATLGELNTTIASIDTAELYYIFAMEGNIWNLLTVDLNSILEEISQERLMEIVAGSTGVQDMIVHIASQLDLIIAAVQPSKATLTSKLSSAMSYIEAVDISRDQNGSLRDIGSIFYLERTIAAIANTTFSDQFPNASYFESYAKPSVFGPIVDNKIKNSYTNNVKCITDACIKNSIEIYNNGRLSDVLPEEITSALPVQPRISRVAATALPSIISAILLIMTVLVFFFPSCGYGVACCSACAAPWLFLIFGALAFPFLLIAADVCSGVENAGSTALVEVQPYMCEQIGGTTNSRGFCAVNLDVPVFSMSLELDTPELFLSLINDCSGLSLANVDGNDAVEPLQALYQTFQSEASQIVQGQLDELLNVTLPSIGIVLRSALRNDINASSADLRDNIITLAEELEIALGCEAFNSAYDSIQESFCCDFGRSFYWAIAGWYLLAFCMLLCGLPLGCIAAKRLKDLRQSREQFRQFYVDSGTMVADSRVGRAMRIPPPAGTPVVSPPADAALSYNRSYEDYDDPDNPGLAPYASVIGEGSDKSTASRFRNLGASFKKYVHQEKDAVSDNMPNEPLRWRQMGSSFKTRFHRNRTPSDNDT